MPSIVEQIAKDLNISSASVSRALNDRPGVGAELRERILEKARELNYTSSVVARGLAKSQSFGIGFFVREKPGLSAHTDPFYSEILHGVEQTIARTDYHMTMATLTADILSDPTQFRFVRERRVDGLILAGPDIPSEFIMTLLQSEIPIVLVDNRLEFSTISCVNADDEGGGYRAARYLLERGHRHIGVLAGPSQWASNRRRVVGYLLALQEAGLELHTIHMQNTTIESGEEGYRQMMKQQPQITALGAVNDSMAIGAIRAARAQGKRIPDDLAVIGFDDIAWAQLNDPPLTTIQIPKRQMGKEAVNRLIAMLNDPDLSAAEITVTVQLVQRGSA
ncbi:MAG: LacI family DNA-binding transcriptional regulator [Anaerolineae bacterium]